MSIRSLEKSKGSKRFIIGLLIAAVITSTVYFSPVLGAEEEPIIDIVNVMEEPEMEQTEMEEPEIQPSITNVIPKQTISTDQIISLDLTGYFNGSSLQYSFTTVGPPSFMTDGMIDSNGVFTATSFTKYGAMHIRITATNNLDSVTQQFLLVRNASQSNSIKLEENNEELPKQKILQGNGRNINVSNMFTEMPNQFLLDDQDFELDENAEGLFLKPKSTSSFVGTKLITVEADGRDEVTIVTSFEVEVVPQTQLRGQIIAAANRQNEVNPKINISDIVKFLRHDEHDQDVNFDEIVNNQDVMILLEQNGLTEIEEVEEVEEN